MYPSPSNQKKIDEILQKLRSNEYKLKDPSINENDRKKLLMERERYEKEARKLGVTVPSRQVDEVPISTSTSGSSDGWGVTQAINNVWSYRPFSGSSKKSEEEERLRQQELQLDAERRARRARLAEDNARLENQIRQTTMKSQMRTEYGIQKVMEEERERNESLKRESEQIERKRIEDERRELELEREQHKRLVMERRQAAEEQNLRVAQLQQELWDQEERQKEQTEKARMENQRRLEKSQTAYSQQQESREKEMTGLKEKAAKEREEQLRELHRLDEEVRRVQEESRRKYEELARKTKEQMEMIMKLLERAQWSRAIERNWEIRIKALRSTGRRMEQANGDLRVMLVQAKHREQNSQLVKRRMDQVKNELTEIVKVMDRESENLDKMYEFSGKMFVMDVSNSLKTVSNLSKTFIDYLNDQSCLENVSKSDAEKIYDKVDEMEKDIRRAYDAIPTLSSMKMKYANDWRNFEEASSSEAEAITDGNEDGHVIIIEEIE